MFRATLLILILSSANQSVALNIFGDSSYIHQTISIVLGGLIISTVAQNTNDTTVILATNSFVYFSTWAGNALAFTDLLGWLVDWLAGYIFYKKSDTIAVTSLSSKIKDLNKDESHTNGETITSTTYVINNLIDILSRDYAVSIEDRKQLIEMLELMLDTINNPKEDVYNDIAITITDDD